MTRNDSLVDVNYIRSMPHLPIIQKEPFHSSILNEPESIEPSLMIRQSRHIRRRDSQNLDQDF